MMRGVTTGRWQGGAAALCWQAGTQHNAAFASVPFITRLVELFWAGIHTVSAHLRL